MQNKLILFLLIFLTTSCASTDSSVISNNNNIKKSITSDSIDAAVTTSSSTSTSTTSTTTKSIYGKWEVYEVKSEFNDSISYVANLKSTKEVKSKNFTSIPNLQIVCLEGEYKLNIDTGLVLTPYYEGNFGEVQVNVRLDKNPSQTLIVDEGTNQEVVFFREPEIFIAFQAISNTMLVEITPFNSNKDYAEFELDGLFYVLNSFQEECYSRPIEVGLLAKKNKFNQQKLTTAAGEHFWSYGSDTSKNSPYLKTAFESRISPLRIAFLGDWDEKLKQNIKNDLLTTLQKVVEIEIKDEYEKYYTDILVYNSKESINKDWGLDINSPTVDQLGYFAVPLSDNQNYFDECLVWIGSSNTKREIYKCLGGSIYFDVIAGKPVRNYSYNFSMDTFLELETNRLTEIDLALIGLVYNNSLDTLGGYSSLEEFIKTLSSYDNS